MNYEKRLLKELSSTENSRFTANEYASIWKRSRLDVRLAVSNLLANCQIKMLPTGELYAI